MDRSKPPTPESPPKHLLVPPAMRNAARTPGYRGKRPPRLVMPLSNSPQMYHTPYVANAAKITPNPNANPYMYPHARKTSDFMFTQFDGIRDFAKSGLSLGEKSTLWLYQKLSSLSRKWFTHIFLSVVMTIFTVGGAAIFAGVEGAGEDLKIADIRRERYGLISTLRNMSIVMPDRNFDEEWIGRAAVLLVDYEDKMIKVYKAKAAVEAYRGKKTWTFSNSIVYCATIYTTIGYGHIAPVTTTGRALTIVYAIIGIPLFLIALTDFGKLFTRCIKFVWSYVRRLYYTGSCRSVRKTTHVEEFVKGAQMMYEIATLRKPSMLPDDPENPQVIDPSAIGADSPTTPALSNYEIDDEFNLPISLAIFMLILYILLGAVMYCVLEQWDFFASFYFVFISMSTIGFGDYVPTHPICMMASIVYLVFGLALMSMCINVVQAKLSDTFKDASAKLGATMGLNVADEDGSIETVPPALTDIPELHENGDDQNVNAEKKESGKEDKKGSENKKSKKEKKVKHKDENGRDDAEKK